MGASPRLGWIPSGIDTDMGEDLLVRIYDGGESTGLSFYVQIKSIADSGKRQHKKTATIPYSLDVKDLKHWEKQTSLVVLVLWDVEKQQGWWQPVPEMIKALDAAGKGWRKKKTATVAVPLANGTDKEGMNRLRWVVADYNLVLVPKSGTVEMTFAFPDTEEGRSAHKSLLWALDTGEATTISREFISEVTLPAWHRRLYGPDYPSVDKVQLAPVPVEATLLVRVEVDGVDGPASIHFIELRPVKQGKKRVVLSNEHQRLPLCLTLLWDADAEIVRLGFEWHALGATVYAASDAVRFISAAAREGFSCPHHRPEDRQSARRIHRGAIIGRAGYQGAQRDECAPRQALFHSAPDRLSGHALPATGYVAGGHRGH
ncbi:MAG: DUF4365 domain-containing protein [Minicystis sp.]